MMTRQGRTEVAVPLALYEALVAIAVEQRTKHGHRAMIGSELAGYCKPWKACYPRCLAFQATLDAAQRLLDAAPGQAGGAVAAVPTQLRMLEEAV